MDEEKKRKLVFIIILILNIVIPLLLALKDAALGGFLLLIGLWFTSRAYSMLRADARRNFNPSHERIKANSAGRTILVQVVDDFGRELPPEEAEKLLNEVRAKAGPRDTVVSARFKVNQNQNISDKG